MVKYSAADVRTIMNHATQVRNMSVIAHVDHGKSTLTDSLLAAAGIISQKHAGDQRFMDSRDDEQARCITIKSSSVSLCFNIARPSTTVSSDEAAVAPMIITLLDMDDNNNNNNDSVVVSEKQITSGSIATGSENDANANASNSLLSSKYLINLIDCPGHVDFSSEVTAALRVTDGALVVIDCIEGVCVQTETVLRQALSERIKPVLMLNKLDRALQELKMDHEALYQALARSIENTNVLISTNNGNNNNNDNETSSSTTSIDWTVDPVQGTVAFGSGLQGWAFTIPQFARFYARKLGVDVEKLKPRLWGDHFYDTDTQKWHTGHITVSPKTGKPLKRGFCLFVLEPIFQMFKAIDEAVAIDTTSNAASASATAGAKLDKMLTSLNIRLSSEERQQTENKKKELLRCIMQKWLPAASALLELIIDHLPSPVEAQKHRCPILYEGPQDDKYAEAIRACDPNGPLIVFISKMLPQDQGSRFIAFGRVFSGCIRGGQKVRILGPDYIATPGTSIDSSAKNDVYIANVQKTLVMMGRFSDPIDDVPCGSTVGLVGVDKYLLKCGTITDNESVDAFPLRNMKYSVAPVVQQAIEPVKPADLPRLIQGLKRLSKSDPLVQCFTTEAGEHIIAGAGELHLEICLKDLCELYAKGVEIKVSEPVVAFRETIVQESSQTCLSVSPNRHNRLYFRASPIPFQLAQELEMISKGGGSSSSKVTSASGTKTAKDEKIKLLTSQQEYGWDGSSCKKIWCFGPTAGLNSDASSSIAGGTNILFDDTKAVQYVHEIKDSVVAAFEWATKEGVLCNEGVFGIKYSLVDAVLHADSIHRGGGQIIPTARRVFYASQLTAAPRLVEPVFVVNIQAPVSVTGSIYSVLSRRRGVVFSEEHTPNNMLDVRAHLPVIDSFGFTSELRAATGGQAFPQCSFSHWSVMPGDPITEPSSRAAVLVTQTRVRKGLAPQIPILDSFIDRI